MSVKREKNMIVYVISHDTRCDGAGDLNGEISRDKETLLQEIEEYTGYKRGETDDVDGVDWIVEEDSFSSSEDVFEIYEKEV